jgi:general secretion pathway protein C
LLSLAYKLVEPAKYLIIVGIAYTLATAGWYLISGPTPAPLTDAPATQGRTPTKPALSVAEIAARNLFGQASADATKPAVFDAPETRLRLNLEGVFQADIPEESAAIIAEQGRPGERYPVGGRLPGNAVLTEVHADRIVLRRGTVFETLKFADAPTVLTAAADDDMQPQEIYDPGDIPVPETYTEPTVDAMPEAPQDGGATGTNATSNPASLTSVVQTYRERLQQDPTGTLSALGVAPVSTSGAQGYRLDNLAGSPYLAQTGLQAGDVVLSVNGRPVGDVQQDQLQIDNIVAQGSARLEVQRGTRRFFVTASLK